VKFGIITPVFDGCLTSLELLFQDVNSQTHTNWAWIICSNGYSEKIAAFAREKNQLLSRYNRNVAWRLGNFLMPRLTYLHLPYQETPDPRSLLRDLGRRRDYCIGKIHADYLFMFDADAKLLDSDMFRIIDEKLGRSPKDLCVYRILHDVGILPVFPIQYGRIDMLNFCVKARLAKEIGYPTDLSPDGMCNDYRYFDRALNRAGDYLFIDQIFGHHNGNNNNSYINLLKQLSGECARK
jgi:hypothetical protein